LSGELPPSSKRYFIWKGPVVGRELGNKPKLHGFRRAFALNMLRSGVDIFVLQRVMGHSDLPVLRRYLAQNDEDNQLAHMRGSPVDNHL
jgi:integrase